MALIFLGAVAQTKAEGFDLAQIAFADLARTSKDFGNCFQAIKLNQTHKREFQFVRVHGVENNHFVAAKPEVLDPIQDSLLIIKKVADENDDAFAANLPRHVMEDGGYIGLSLRLE